MRRRAMYITLLGLGTLLILASTVYKFWADNRSEQDANRLAETRHQETLAVVTAAQEQREAYIKAREELRVGGAPVTASSERSNVELDLKRLDDRLDRALREVAPAMVERLRQERRLTDAATAA